jgi:hypothetical protein
MLTLQQPQSVSTKCRIGFAPRSRNSTSLAARKLAEIDALVAHRRDALAHRALWLGCE